MLNMLMLAAIITCFYKPLRESPSIAVYTVILFSYCHYIVGLYSIGHNKTNVI